MKTRESDVKFKVDFTMDPWWSDPGYSGGIPSEVLVHSAEDGIEIEMPLDRLIRDLKGQCTELTDCPAQGHHYRHRIVLETGSGKWEGMVTFTRRG